MDPRMLRCVDGDAERYPHVLDARFRRVFERILELWGSAEFDDYISSLFINDSGSRQGFPEDAMTEIFRLSQAHDEARRRKAEVNPWELEAARRELAELQLELTPRGMQQAIETAQPQAVELFIKAGFDVESKDERGWTPLMMAAFFGSEASAELLINAGADVHVKDGQGYQPAHWAAVQAYDKVLRQLLRRGASPSAQSERGITPLIQAAAIGHLPTVQALLDHHAPVNQADNEGWTPLHKAVANRFLDVVSVLKAAGADAHAAHASGKTPLDIAREKSLTAIAALLVA